MKTFLLEILADPQTGYPLKLDNQNKLVNMITGNHYPIVGDIPNFIHEIPLAGNSDAPLHKDIDSSFNYRSHYENDAKLFDYFKEDEQSVTRNERKRNREAIIKAIPESAKLILDIGCGGAWVAAHFLPKERQVISMDISSVNPVKALKELPHPNHSAVIADAFFLPFKDNSIDCIIASEVIEHVYDPTLFISNIIKKIKTGGKLILMTPYNEKIEYYLCVHCNKPTPKSAHLHSFNEKKINQIIPLDRTKVKTTSFSNKYFLKLRLYNLLSFLPFKIWLAVDSLANFFFKKPLSFMIEIKKIN